MRSGAYHPESPKVETARMHVMRLLGVRHFEARHKIILNIERAGKSLHPPRFLAKTIDRGGNDCWMT